MPSPKNTPKNALGNSQEASPSPINQKKLTRELHAKPRDFTHIKQIISDIKTDKGAREPKLYNDIFRFPLFVPEWDSTAIAVLYNIITIGYKNKINFLKTVSDHNISSKLKEKRDLWIKYFCTTLRMGDNFSPEQTAHITELRQRLEKEEDRFTSILREQWAELGATYRALWSQKGLPAETIFLNQHIVREKPEINIPYIDEFLCYNDSQLFSDLMNGIILESGASFGLWISARSDLLADVSTETYKLFCQMFGLGQEGLFDATGNITQTALSKMPHISFESLGMVEQRKKEHIAKQESERKQQELKEMTQQHIEAALAQEITGTCDADFILTLNTIPAGIKTIEITITRNRKTYARTDVSDPFGTTIDLKECLFTTFPSNTINQPWDAIKEWSGGDTYEISLCGKIGTKKTQKQVLHKWTQKKTIIKKLPDSSLDHLGDITQGTKKRVRTLVSPTVQHPVTPTQTPTPTMPTPPSLKKQEEKKQEEEDLQVAIELLMESYSSDREREDMLTDNALWDEENQVLTLRIPMEELFDLYVPTYLSSGEYGAMTQWTAKITPKGWEYSLNMPPEAIQKNINTVLKRIQSRKQKDHYDNELAGIGFTVSESKNTTLRNSIQPTSINNKMLSENIKDISDKFPRVHGKTEYKFYTGQVVGGIIQSFSLVKNKAWSATLKIVPHLHFEFKILGNAHEEKHREVLAKRIENALLTVLYGCIARKNTGVSGLVDQTQTLEDTRKLRNSYRKELKKNKARILVEHDDGSFEIVTNIGQDTLKNTVQELQRQHGAEKIALLYRRNTYAFVGDNSICKPSDARSNEDYMSLNLPERREILRERILKTLFNGNSGVIDRAAFIFGSAVYLVLKLEEASLKESWEVEKLTRDDIDDTFVKKFIKRLKANGILVSYRDFCAGWVEDLTKPDEEEVSPE